MLKNREASEIQSSPALLKVPIFGYYQTIATIKLNVCNEFTAAFKYVFIFC